MPQLKTTLQRGLALALLSLLWFCWAVHAQQPQTTYEPTSPQSTEVVAEPQTKLALPLPPAPATADEQSTKRLSIWLPFWQWDSGLEQIERLGCAVDQVHPFIYGLGKNGQVYLTLKKAQAKLRRLRQIAKRCPNMKLIPTLVNDVYRKRKKPLAKDPKIAARLLSDDKRRKRHIDEIHQLVLDNNWDGIDIDYENMDSKNRDDFTAFITELYDKLQANKMILNVTLQGKTSAKQERWSGSGAQNWPALARVADELKIMAYGYTYHNSDAGPFAPIYWLEDILKYAEQLGVPADKLSFGLTVSTGLHWAWRKQTKRINWQELTQIKKESSVNLQLDPFSLSSYLAYHRGGRRHTVWFEDVRALTKKLEWLHQTGRQNVTIWNIGGGEKGLVELLNAYYQQPPVKKTALQVNAKKPVKQKEVQ